MEAAQKIVEQVFTVVVGMHTHPVGMSMELKDAQVKFWYKESKNDGETLLTMKTANKRMNHERWDPMNLWVQIY